jgi:2,3-bisphosphoglycerate-independent phosphoglycerate mutase
MDTVTLDLKHLKSFKGREGPLLLIIMDGIGIGRKDETNAIYLANTPNLDRLFSSALYCRLKAHGTAVGLPSDKDMGNSEVGHNTIGAGRIFDQGALLVGRAIETEAIFETENWKTIVRRGRGGGTVHFLGLLSDGNVHSHIDHLNKLIDKCVISDVPRVCVHALLDGRDVDQKSALNYVIPLEEKLKRISAREGFFYCIASGGGRMNVTMDRYNADWDVVKRGWNAHVRGEARPFGSAEEAIRTYYAEDPDITDQYIDAFVIVDLDGNPVGPVLDGDAMVCFNFRGDRSIEISRAFTEDDFDEFERSFFPDVFYAGMMEYDGDTHMPPNFLVTPPLIDRTVSEYLCAEKITSFAISETQKFGHVTYFWNGNRSGYIDESLETYVEIPSDKIQFDKAPGMKAEQIKNKTIELLLSGRYRFGRLNFANGDMVGHTGSMLAAITAVETVDKCIGDILNVIDRVKGVAVVTADHGNSDEMFTIDKQGKKNIKTAHTLNPVPFVIYDSAFNEEYKMASLKESGLANIAATILNLMGYEKVADYAESLITVA